MADSFKAFVIEDADGKPKGSFKQLTLADLPDNDVLVEVAYYTVNYKDGLAATGKGRIAGKLPMVGGIDLGGYRGRIPRHRRGALGVGGTAARWRLYLGAKRR